MKNYVVKDWSALTPGRTIRIEHRAYLKEDNTNALEKVFRTDDKQNRQEEEELHKSENDLLKEMKSLARKWDDFAYKLQQLEYAKQYKALAKKNEEYGSTCNGWKHTEDEAEISNHLYRFQAAITVDTEAGYRVNWALDIRTINRDADNISMIHRATVNNKKFLTLAEADKYVKGRFAKYQNLFNEEFPEIPVEFADNLKFMGVLLPGYKVEVQKSGN